MNAELADQNAQQEAKRLISELKLKNEEADRRLQQVKEKNETAEKLADALIDRALNDPPKREALITTFRENAFNYLKKADPKLYEEILNIGRRESMATEKKELELGKDKSKGRTM
jgi:predicted transcriptional regulator